MSETTLAEPLSGEEIQDVIAEEVKRAMQRDCHLNPVLAYLAFEAEITIKLKLKDNGRIETVDQQVRVEGGNGPKGPLTPKAVRQALEGIPPDEVYFHLNDRPPNVVRQEAGLPIPTMVENASGRKEVKAMKFAKRTEHEGPEHEKKEHEHDPKKPPQPGQQPGPQPPHPGQQEPKR